MNRRGWSLFSWLVTTLLMFIALWMLFGCAPLAAQAPGDTVVTIIKRSTPVVRCATDSALIVRLAALQLQYGALQKQLDATQHDVNQRRWQRSVVEVAAVATLVGVLFLLSRSQNNPVPLPGEEDFR